MNKPGRNWRVAIYAAAAMAFLCKIVLAWKTYGTNDVRTWQYFTIGARDQGLQLYLTTWDFNHPPSMIHVLRVIDWLQSFTGLPFPFLLRLPAILADAGSLWLVMLLLRERIADRSIRIALLLLAASPQLILISGFHGNTDSVMIFFVLLAVYWIDRPVIAGLFFGCAMCIKVVPVVLLPAFLLYLPDWRRRVRFAGAMIALLAAVWSPFIFEDPALVYKRVFGYASIYGSWGISSLLERLPHAADTFHPLSEAFYDCGKALLVAVICAVSYWMNRRVPKPALFSQAGVIFFLFLCLSNGFGVQYLAWLTPFAVEWGALPTAVIYATSGTFLLLVYNYWSKGFPWYFADSYEVGGWEQHLDYFQVVCWVSVVLGLMVALKHLRTGTPLRFSLRSRIVLGVVTPAVLACGFGADSAAIPLRNSGSPPIGRVSPAMADYYLMRARTDCDAGAYEECAAASRDALRFRAGLAEAYNDLSVAYAGLKQWHDAVAAAQEALRIDPNLELARENLDIAINGKDSPPYH